MKNIIKDMLIQLLANKKWNVTKLSDISNVPFETVKNLYYGKIDNPRLETIVAIADALDVSVDFLIGRTNYAKDELELLKNYRQCSSHGKHFVMSMSTFESNYSKFENEQKCTNEIDLYLPKEMELSEETIDIPCLEPTGVFKDGVLYDTSIKTRIKTHLKNAFMAFKLPNDSLAHTYYKDDIIFLEKRHPNIGEIAVFHKDNNIFIRQYNREGNKFVLRSLNINSDDIILNTSEFQKYTIVGTCMYLYRKNDEN